MITAYLSLPRLVSKRERVFFCARWNLILQTNSFGKGVGGGGGGGGAL